MAEGGRSLTKYQRDLVRIYFYLNFEFAQRLKTKSILQKLGSAL